jgi:glutaredoxin
METIYIKPTNVNYTVYSISNCKYCVMAKEHINKKTTKCTIINCDKFIGSCRERDNFYNFMKHYTIIPYIHFPMIFKDGKFIGGLKELLNIRESATSTASATSAARKTKKSASSTTKKTKITI